MIGFYLSFLIIPLLPFLTYGEVWAGIKNDFFRKEKVLGQQNFRVTYSSGDFCKLEGERNYERPSLFPLDQAGFSGLPPKRKPNFQEIKIWAGSSVAIDVDSGTILEYQNGRKQTQIASLTKIMTALLVMENIPDLEEEIILGREALMVDGTVVGCPTSVFCNSDPLKIGEKMTARNLMKAMLMASANDAATALAIHIGGNENNFTSLMNKKARDLGLKDTNFCTPSGLEIEGRESECYSSAYDIARIAAYSLKYPEIWDIMKIEEEVIYSVDKKYSHAVKNTDLLLSEMPDCLGGKTGFTPLAGKSLLLATTDPGKKSRIIAVILNDENRWTDMRRLINWIFENYEWK